MSTLRASDSVLSPKSVAGSPLPTNYADRSMRAMKRSTVRGNKLSGLYNPATLQFESMAFSEGVIKKTPGANPTVPDSWFYHYYLRDHLGSTRMVVKDDGTLVEASMYQPYGSMEAIASGAEAVRERFTGKELDKDGKTVSGAPGMGLIYFGARYYDPDVGVWISCDAMEQVWSPYSYANNPIVFVDPDGNFLTWSISKGGLSVGFNLTPMGIPWGAGINVGWGNGFSLGAYNEVGYRVGGTGLGGGVYTQQSVDYNFESGNLSSTISESANISYFGLNAGVNASETYSYTNDEWSYGWGASAGIGLQNKSGSGGIGAFVGYGGDFNGNNEWTYGIGGYYDPSGKSSSAKNVNSDQLAENLPDATNIRRSTPIKGGPSNGFEVYTNPKTGVKQISFFNAKRGALEDIDYGHPKHGHGTPHRHYWENGKRGPPERIYLPVPIYRMPLFPMIPYDYIRTIIDPYAGIGA